MKTTKRTISLLLTFALLFTLAATAAAQQAEKDYLLMGDSIAQGFGVKNPEEASYGAIVANTNGYNYYNIGRSARTTEGLLIQVTENEYARSLIKDAEIISLSIGGNDYFTDEGVVGIAVGLVAGIETPRYKQLTANMIENFAKIIDEIKALNPDVVILAQTVLCSWYGLLGGAYKHGTNTVNDMIYGYLEEHPGAYEIVDVATAMNGHREYIARDSVHPNAEGNIVIARLVLQKLKELGLGENTEPVLIAEGIEYDYYVEEYGEAAGKFIGFIVRLATGHNPF
ncbi:MAG: SGNH/GDSL hydrolase family protein [Clostridia bacterium]|nr:SGNH/GDSL hydrolase family protein [Clostridia bacterium]